MASRSGALSSRSTSNCVAPAKRHGEGSGSGPIELPGCTSRPGTGGPGRCPGRRRRGRIFPGHRRPCGRVAARHRGRWYGTSPAGCCSGSWAIRSAGRVPVLTPPGAKAAARKRAARRLGVAIDDQHRHRHRQIDDQEPMIVGGHGVAGQMGGHGVLARRAEQDRETQGFRFGAGRFRRTSARAGRGIFFQCERHFAGLSLPKFLTVDFHVQRHAGRLGLRASAAAT